MVTLDLDQMRNLSGGILREWMDIRKSIKMVMKYSNLSMAQGKSLQETNSTGKKKIWGKNW